MSIQKFGPLWRKIETIKIHWKANMNNTITLPKTIFKRLEKISAGSRHTPQAIIKQAITDRLEYEEWKLEQIDAGLADLKAGRVLSDEEFWKRINKPKNERFTDSPLQGPYRCRNASIT